MAATKLSRGGCDPAHIRHWDSVEARNTFQLLKRIVVTAPRSVRVDGPPGVLARSGLRGIFFYLWRATASRHVWLSRFSGPDASRSRYQVTPRFPNTSPNAARRPERTQPV